MCVVSAVKMHVMTGGSLSQVCGELCSYYKNSYPNDADFELDIEKTSGKLLDVMRSHIGDEQLPSSMTQFQYCITTYELDGRNKRKRLFGGTWFTKSKSRNPNREQDCVRNMMIYYTGTMTDRFPVAPTGWSIIKSLGIVLLTGSTPHER